MQHRFNTFNRQQTNTIQEYISTTTDIGQIAETRTLDLWPRQEGYYYKPHNKLTIRGFSDYIETGLAKNVVGIPNYAYFSESQNLFIWRDLYTYGFIDNDGNGVNYPFFNYTHYPYDNYEFRIIPEGTNYIESDLSHNASIYGTGQPKVDNCE